MSGLALDLALDLAWASLGLLLSAVAAALALRLWRRDPVRSYRLGVAILAATLALPLAQGAARAFGLPLPHPLRGLVAALQAERAEVATVPARTAATQVPQALLHPVSLPYPLPLPLDAAERRPASVVAAFTPIAASPSAPVAGSTLVRWRPFAALLYGLGVLAALANTLRRVLSTRRLLRGSRAVTCSRVGDAWRRVAGDSPLFARTRLLESQALASPACVGLLRPAVVLPAAHDLADHADVLECVLAHELVHLERRDGWVLVGEELLRALFWFHPAAWWLVARLERLRELSCDSLVVRRTGKRRRYASALVEYATWMQAGPRRPGARVGSMAAVMPWSDSKGQLTRRIEMLLDTRDIQGAGARGITPTAVGLVFTFLWSGQLALATSSCASTSDSRTDTCELHEDGSDAIHDGEHKVFVVKKKSTQGKDGAHKVVRIVGADGEDQEYIVLGGEGDEAVEWTWLDAHGNRQEVHGKIIAKQDADHETVWVEESESGDGSHEVHKAPKVIKLDRSGGQGGVYFSRQDESSGQIIELELDPTTKGKVIVRHRGEGHPGVAIVEGHPDAAHEKHFELHTTGDKQKNKHVFQWRSSGEGELFFGPESGEADQHGESPHGKHFELKIQGDQQAQAKVKGQNSFEWHSGGDTEHELHGDDRDGAAASPHELHFGQHSDGHGAEGQPFVIRKGASGFTFAPVVDAWGVESAGDSDVSKLRRELATTRATLEAQKAEIEELRRAIEKLSRKRDEFLR